MAWELRRSTWDSLLTFTLACTLLGSWLLEWPQPPEGKPLRVGSHYCIYAFSFIGDYTMGNVQRGEGTQGNLGCLALDLDLTFCVTEVTWDAPWTLPCLSFSI